MQKILLTAFVCLIVSSSAFGLDLTLLRQIEFLSQPADMLQKIDSLQASSIAEKEIYIGILYHNLALRDTAKYAQKAVQTCKAAYEQYNSALIRAYYGSAITLTAKLANENGDIVTASAKLEEGARIIDAAVTQDPTNLNIRALRMNNAIEVSASSPFPRYDVAKQDIQYFLSRLSELDADTRSMVYYDQGIVALHDRNTQLALSAFEKSIAASPSCDYAKLARKQLALLEE